MQTPKKPGVARQLIAQIAAFGLTIGILYGLWRLAGGEERSGIIQMIFAGLSILVSFAVLWGVRKWMQALASRQNFEAFVVENHQQRQSLENRLNGVIRLNQLLIDAQSEQELIESSLGVIADITGAVGCSFLPFDEWGIALAPHTYGSFPAPVLRAWADHLSTISVRERCQSCTKPGARGGEPCEMLGAPFANDSIRVYCLPLERNERIVGMLNFYLPANRSVSSGEFEFIRVLMHEMVLAIEMQRLRDQELATLHQLQMVSGPKEDIEGSIRALVEGLNNVVDIDGARVEIKASEPRFPGVHFTFKNKDWLESSAAQALIEKAMAESSEQKDTSLSVNYGDSIGMVLSLPIRLTNGATIGAMLITADPESYFEREHLSLVETIAARIALLVENQREQLDAQFKIVIAERIRLAREIHDSLAQTLAYLKLTAGQMQNLLARGDLSRLGQTLNQSYQALTEAYLEIREVIDNLRIVPKQSIGELLSNVSEDFEKSSGLHVGINITGGVPEIIPEVQAQLLRVIQEALSNIRKHAKASHVQISLGVWNRQLFIEVSDDGIGFDSEDIPELSRHGLQGMRERAELIGADFQIISQAGKGTRVRVQLPAMTEEKLV